ncbi:Hypothetical_protein [Hexamita inflata]|uniref:Hypothetical_protein n=1 Tax=Hexamita inflata TaxID=28002 RepID=A0AA86THK9_9EUKA|nr:Hypothetical protein HINF_LOCUS3947 [Hexamita inflata]
MQLSSLSQKPRKYTPPCVQEMKLVRSQINNIQSSLVNQSQQIQQTNVAPNNLNNIQNSQPLYQSELNIQNILAEQSILASKRYEQELNFVKTQHEIELKQLKEQHSKQLSESQNYQLFDSFCAQIDESNQLLRQSLSQVQKLEKDNAILSFRANENAQKLSEQRSAIEYFTEQLAKKETDSSKQSVTIQEAEQKINQLQTELASKTATLQEKQTYNDDLKLSNEKHQGEIEKLQKVNDTLKQNMNLSLQHLQDMDDSFKQSQVELSDALLSLKLEREQNEALSNLNVQLDDRVRDMENQINDLQNENKSLKLDLASSNQVQSSNKQLQTELSEKISLLNDTVQQLTDVQSELKQIQNDYTQLHTTHSDYTAHNEQLQAELQAQIALQSEQIHSLSTELNTISENSTNATIQILQQSLSSQTKSTEQLQAQVSQFKPEIRAHLQTINQLELKLFQYELTNQQLSKINENDSQRILSLEAQNEDLSQKLTEFAVVLSEKNVEQEIQK